MKTKEKIMKTKRNKIRRIKVLPPFTVGHQSRGKNTIFSKNNVLKFFRQILVEKRNITNTLSLSNTISLKEGM
jgi:hypothetical protein